MANQEHVDQLKQGVELWNRWRREHQDVQPDLRDTDLRGVDLSGADLHGTDFSGTDLREADLTNALLSGSDLYRVDLSRAVLSRANLSRVDLSRANLSRANLSRANLSGARLSGAHLNSAELSFARLGRADLIGVDLSFACLTQASLWDTILARIDLRSVKGLIEIQHLGPSVVQVHSIQLPQDGSALHFLRGVGVSVEWIDVYRVQMTLPIQYYSCFISYSSKDETLARRLHADLQAYGVRCWFAPEDIKIGEKLRVRVDEAIHLQDKLLLLLSEHAITSTWVEDEVEAALEKEQRQQREVLFPIRLDASVMQTTQAWAAKLRRTRHIGDFTNWTNPQAYQQAFERLLRDLKAEIIQDGKGTP